MTSRGLHKVEQLLSYGRTIKLLLAIDTAGPTIVLGLVRNGRVLEAFEQSGQSHAAGLPTVVSGLLKRAQVEFTELSGVAVGVGPGSFTGVRVGLSYAKGLAFAAQCPLVGVSSLESIAVCALDCSQTQAGTTVCAVIDAGRGQFYAALYRVSERGLEQVLMPSLVDTQCLSSCLTGEVILVGDGAEALERQLRELSAAWTSLRAVNGAKRRAAALAAIGAARLAVGQTDSAAALEPLYVRAAQVRPCERATV
jgi:tRNA threonylcarbamoyladenosine biosynthesis protein TsaB